MGLIKIFNVFWVIFFALWHQELTNPLAKFGDTIFDSQMLAMWAHFSQKGLLPYRDIFYPYGLLDYFRYSHSWFNFLAFSLPPSYMTIFYLTTKRLSKNRLFPALFSGAFVWFVWRFTGFESFVRYGASLSLALAYIMSPSAILAIFSGLLFGLMPDQGAYSLMAILSLEVVGGILTKKQSSQLFRKLLVMVAGFTLGTLPLLVYLMSTGSAIGFIQTFGYFQDLVYFAKTPFTRAALSPNGLFTIAALLISIFYCSYKIIVKRDFEFNTRTIFAVALQLSAFFQKNLIRSLGGQVTFAAFLLTTLIILNMLSDLKIRILFTILLVVVSTRLGPVLLFSPDRQIDFKLNQSSINVFPDTHYSRVIQALKADPEYDGRVFSFPGHPLFYADTGQKPPYYLTAYESSPRYAQQKLIDYIESEKINYVLYDRKNDKIQDGVPNLLRAYLLHRYLLTNFTPVQDIDGFTIMKRSHDPAETPFLDSFKVIELGRVPYLVARDFSGDLPPRNEMATEGHIFGIHLRFNSSKMQEIILERFDGITTTVSLTGCEKTVGCVIPLHLIPQYYLGQSLKSLTANRDQPLEIGYYPTPLEVLR